MWFDVIYDMVRCIMIWHDMTWYDLIQEKPVVGEFAGMSSAQIVEQTITADRIMTMYEPSFMWYEVRWCDHALPMWYNGGSVCNVLWCWLDGHVICTWITSRSEGRYQRERSSSSSQHVNTPPSTPHTFRLHSAPHQHRTGIILSITS